MPTMNRDFYFGEHPSINETERSIPCHRNVATLNDGVLR